MVVVYKVGSLITILDILLKLKARLKTKTKATRDALGDNKNKTTNVFMLTLVELENNLS